MNLQEQFNRHFKITGSKNTKKQDVRLLKKYFLFYLEKKTTLKKLENLSQEQINGFYHYILNFVKKNKLSENYAKDILYSANKLIKQINKRHKKDLNLYNVPKFLNSVKNKTIITVTKQEYKNIKELRHLFNGEVPKLQKIEFFFQIREL